MEEFSMKDLQELFKQVNTLIKKLNDLNDTKLNIEITNKDNEILQNYIKTLNKIEDINTDIKKVKDNLYESMLNEDIDLLEGKYCDISLKKPYYKTDFNLKLFLEDYKPTNSLYKKYVNKKLIKGNINIKLLNENKH